MNYLIVYDHTQEFSPEAIHEVVVVLGTDWWHYLPDTYIITTDKTSKAIADIIRAAFPGLRFLVIKIDRSDFNGILDGRAWKWLAKTKVIKIKTLPPITPSIGTKISTLPHINSQNALDEALRGMAKLRK